MGRKEFGTQLISARERIHITATDLAAKTEIHIDKIQRYESGEEKPELDDLIKLADCLWVSLDYLAGRSDCAIPTALIGMENSTT